MNDFFGIPFETDYNLLGDEFGDIPAIYVIYTKKKCLDLGETYELKTLLETHPNTRQWVKLAEGDTIYVAFNHDPSLRSRLDNEKYLRERLKPLL